MGNYLVKFGDYDLSEIVSECRFSINNQLGEQVVSGRNGVLINRLATVAIRTIKMRALISGVNSDDVRTQANAIKAALGTDGQYLYAPLDDKVYFAYKTKFSMTPVLLGNGTSVGIIDLEFVCDNPFIIDSTNPVVLVETEIDYLRNWQLMEYQGGPNSSAQTAGVQWTFCNFQSIPTAAGYWDSDGGWMKLQTDATSGRQCGYGSQSSPSGNQDGARLEEAIDFYTILKTGSDLSDIKFIVGMVEDQNSLAAYTAQNQMNFLYETAAAHSTSGNFQTWTDNGSGVPVKSDTGVTVQPNTVYKFRIDARAITQVDFYINDVLVTSHTTKLPTATTTISHEVRLRNNIASGRFFLAGKTMYEYN